MRGLTNALFEDKGVTLDLLWTNANPSSNFAAQTLSLNLSSYKFILIVCRAATTRDMLFTNVCTIGSEPWQQKLFVPDYTMRNRYCTVTTTGISFDSAFYYATYANSAATSTDAQVIPYKIYGVK